MVNTDDVPLWIPHLRKIGWNKTAMYKSKWSNKCFYCNRRGIIPFPVDSLCWLHVTFTLCNIEYRERFESNRQKTDNEKISYLLPKLLYHSFLHFKLLVLYIFFLYILYIVSLSLYVLHFYYLNSKSLF